MSPRKLREPERDQAERRGVAEEGSSAALLCDAADDSLKKTQPTGKGSHLCRTVFQTVPASRRDGLEIRPTKKGSRSFVTTQATPTKPARRSQRSGCRSFSMPRDSI